LGCFSWYLSSIYRSRNVSRSLSLRWSSYFLARWLSLIRTIHFSNHGLKVTAVTSFSISHWRLVADNIIAGYAIFFP
jgi:hypothetical protein